MRAQVPEIYGMNERSLPALSPFIRMDSTADGVCRYVAGFLDESGEICGPMVPLSKECVESAVFARHHFTTMIDARGDVTPCPASIADALLDPMFADGRLEARPLDEMIGEALEISHNEPPEEMMRDLATLRQRLIRSLARVEEAMQLYLAIASLKDDQPN